MKKILLPLFIFFFFNSLSAQQFWVEYQNNYKSYASDSTGTIAHTLECFYLGKENKAGFSINLFALATHGWGEISIQPTLSKQTKAGFLAVSLGAGLETSTVNPRLMGSVFFLKGNTEFLAYWEQGTDHISNNWHLIYLMQKVVQHEEGPYVSFGFHSQRGAVHGIRSEIGLKDKLALWVVLGKPTFKQRSLAALMGLRYFLQ